MITTSDMDAGDEVAEPAHQPMVRRRSLRRLPRRAIVLIAVLMLAAGGLVVERSRSSGSAATAATEISAAELQSKYGTRIDLVALTALGGLVQLRFTVLDKTKAETLFHVAENMPALIAEPSGTVLHAPSGMRHHLTLLDGGSYFVLYANAGNAITPGSPVSVMIDTVKLEHLVAAS